MNDSIQDFLAAIARYPLLTPEQEISLSRQVQRGIELQAKKEPLTKAEQRAVRIGKRAQDAMINGNLRLVVHIAKRYIPRLKNNGMEFMDLIQEGTLGLHRAVEMFDGTKGYKFSTYSYWWVRQAITRAIDTKDRLIRVPQHALERAYKASRFQHEYQQQHGRQPSMAEIADAVGATVEELRIALERNSPHRSLDSLAAEDGSPLIDMIAAELPDESMADGYAEQLEMVFFRLNESERDIVSRRYGLSGHDEESFAAIGKSQGVSRQAISQRCDIACRKLRLMLKTAPFLTEQYDQLPA